MRNLVRSKAVAYVETASLKIADSVRASVAGTQAAKVMAASVALFEAGGKRVLPASAQKGIREVAEKSAHRVLAAVAAPVLEASSVVPSLAEGVVQSMGTDVSAAVKARAPMVGLATRTATTAAKEVLKGAGKAAGVGFVVDGAVAGLEAVVAVRRGAADKKEAVTHVAVEATTGALAMGAGVLLGAGLVALTGGVAAPVVFAVSALGAIGLKNLLRKGVHAAGWSSLVTRPAVTSAE